MLRPHAVDPLAWHWLESGFRRWHHALGTVGYVDTGAAWVAAGPPAAAASDTVAVASAFVRAARAERRRAVFFGVSPSLLATLGGTALAVGRRAEWDPRRWSLGGSTFASLRYQLARAGKHGVTVRAVSADDLTGGTALRSAVERLAASWLERQPMAPMGFLVALELFVLPEVHRYFVAEKDGAVVGFLSAVPALGREGWFLEDLLRTADAPNGTNELLVHACLRSAANDGASYVTLGLSPLDGPIAWPLRVVRLLSRPWFNFVGLARFKERLRPHSREVRYLGGTDGVGRMRALLDVLTAFSQGGLGPFALRTLARSSLALVGALTILLVLWTPLLALASAERWFPSGTIKNAWVLFDVGLAVLLTELCRRYRRPLGVALALAVTADAVLTFVQALHFNLPRARGPLDVVVIGIACAGPAIGSCALWSVVARRSRLERARSSARGEATSARVAARPNRKPSSRRKETVPRH